MNGRILRDFIIVLPRLQFRGRRSHPDPAARTLTPPPRRPCLLPAAPVTSHIPADHIIKASCPRPASQLRFMLPFRTLEFSNLTARLGERFKYFTRPSSLPVWAAGCPAEWSIWRYIWGLTFDRFIDCRKEGRGSLTPRYCFSE